MTFFIALLVGFAVGYTFAMVLDRIEDGSALYGHQESDSND